MIRAQTLACLGPCRCGGEVLMRRMAWSARRAALLDPSAVDVNRKTSSTTQAQKPCSILPHSRILPPSGRGSNGSVIMAAPAPGKAKAAHEHSSAAAPIVVFRFSHDRRKYGFRQLEVVWIVYSPQTSCCVNCNVSRAFHRAETCLRLAQHCFIHSCHDRGREARLMPQCDGWREMLFV